MKNLILCNGLYGDVTSLGTLISEMDFTNTVFGPEIKDFYYVPQGIQEFFSKELNEEIELQHTSGLFRKSSSLIHFENFYQHTLWIGIVALDNAVLHIHEQDTVKTFFDIKGDVDEFVGNECYDSEKWDTVNTIKLKPNDFVFIRPWLFYSLQENSLIQIFLLNQKLD